MSDRQLNAITRQLSKSLSADALIQNTVADLRQNLGVDRVVLYYFYRRWKGQVTFESLSSRHLSILGSTGADDCFNDEYAHLYLQGRVRAIEDIETADIHLCHREFLRSLQVQANLAVPVLKEGELWGLLIAHQTTPRDWHDADIQAMRDGADKLQNAASIRKRSM